MKKELNRVSSFTKDITRFCVMLLYKYTVKLAKLYGES